MLDSITSALVGVSSRDVFQSTPREAGVIIWVQFLQCPPPKICDGQKIAQNFSQFLTTFKVDREYLRNGSTYQKSEKLFIIYNPSHVVKKIRVLWSTNVKVIDSNKFNVHPINVHPMDFYSGDYISAFRGCCAMKFLHALEIDQGYLAHTPTGTGVPPKKKNLIVKIKNLD